MTKLCTLMATLLALGFACPAQAATATGTFPGPLPANALPVPPPAQTGQLQAMQEFAPAPMPDPDLQRPRSDADKPRAEVVPDLYQSTQRRNGQGFVKGSNAYYDTDRRSSIPGPTLNLRVPLQ